MYQICSIASACASQLNVVLVPCNVQTREHVGVIAVMYVGFTQAKHHFQKGKAGDNKTSHDKPAPETHLPNTPKRICSNKYVCMFWLSEDVINSDSFF